MEPSRLKELLVGHKDMALGARDYFARASPGGKDLFSQKEIHIVTGVRRSGKSTLMRLLMQDLVKQGIAARQILYLNFDDERFVEFGPEDFQRLHEAYLDLEHPEGKAYFFLDEIHNIESWERWVTRLYEFHDIKIFLTGSNASMLSAEISSKLTGRNRIVPLFPFSFAEFVRARGVRTEARDFFKPEIKAALSRQFRDYLVRGGFPEPIKTGDTSILQDYFRDIVYRDIVARYGLKRVRELKELTLYLSSNLGSRMSLKRLQDTIGVRSMTTVKNYLTYLEESYLFITVNLFSYSLKQQVYNPPKVYCIDHAMAAEVGFRFSADVGRTLENIVCVELKRRGHEIFYWRDNTGSEVDFLVRRGRDVIHAIQVCSAMETEAARRREIKGLQAAARAFGIKQAVVVTLDASGQEIVDDVRIDIVPIWKWLLDKEGVLDVSTAP